MVACIRLKCHLSRTLRDQNRRPSVALQSLLNSIVIPAYNEEKRLDRTLARIRDYFATAQPRRTNIEIIIVNDGSTDGYRRSGVCRWMQRDPLPAPG